MKRQASHENQRLVAQAARLRATCVSTTQEVFPPQS